MAISEGAKFDHDRMLPQTALHFQYVHVLRARDYSDFALAANDRFNGLRRSTPTSSWMSGSGRPYRELRHLMGKMLRSI